MRCTTELLRKLCGTQIKAALSLGPGYAFAGERWSAFHLPETDESDVH
jgi:hypothetical protein